uniref:G3BP stress granule assembly factor 2a n=1 Tax=Xiphophorus couchianus TaxID=32473 RepID=A0A3B5LU35_9TELE
SSLLDDAKDMRGELANKFYVHNDIFCYEDEVFGDSEAELDEGKVEPMEEPAPEPEPEPEQEPKVEEVKPEVEEKAIEEMEEKTPSPAPVESPPNAQEPAKPRVEAKQETQATPLRPRDQRTRDRPTFTQRGPRPGGRDVESGDMDGRRIVRYPDSHQLFVGNLPHDIDEAELKEFFMSTLIFILLILSFCSRMATWWSCESTPRGSVESCPTLDLWSLTTLILCRESWGPR